ncbi:mitotic spindle assembly checkpoint protein MAD2B-like [Sycon ciliatum]|uniref:mitotic spindle assembly checkpoint protein MAD2B-like n=1 Tax=Sycon ciliatum TaxID=27933 RepID=UPI0020A90C50|eukprot:scpid50818/ scgid28928/ Mitotic spindle assembly checkpoint protein MAD2B; Mitotic arrest deficient 2-like protein 2
MSKKSKPLVGADIVCEFLEVAWHQILFLRDVYPASVFGRRRMYGTSVRMCLHPDVNQYIAQSLEAIRGCLVRGDVETIVLVVRNQAGLVVEQYVFEAAVPERRDPDEFEDRYLLEVEASLRAALLRLTTCAGGLGSLHGDGVTFAVLVKTRRDAAERLAVQSAAQVQPMHWLEANCSSGGGGDGDGGSETIAAPNDLHPINSFSSEHVKLQVFVQTLSKSPTTPRKPSLDW